MITSLQMEALLDALDARLGIASAWLFGSEASGQARSDSDVDLALLFGREVDPTELAEAAGEIGSRFARDVDLIDLERASPILARQVLVSGRLLRDGDPRRRVRFTARLIESYDDLIRVRRPIEQALVERMADGRS